MAYSLRNPTLNDMPDIKDIAAKYSTNPLPDMFVFGAVVKKENKTVAFGILRNHLEAVLYCDGSDRDKVTSLKMLIEKSKRLAYDCNTIECIHVFAQDEDFAKILERFGFKKMSGVPMMLEIK